MSVVIGYKTLITYSTKFFLLSQFWTYSFNSLICWFLLFANFWLKNEFKKFLVSNFLKAYLAVSLHLHHSLDKILSIFMSFFKKKFPILIDCTIPSSFKFLCVEQSDISKLIGGMCETDYSGYPDCRRTTMDALQSALLPPAQWGWGPPAITENLGVPPWASHAQKNGGLYLGAPRYGTWGREKVGGGFFGQNF